MSLYSIWPYLALVAGVLLIIRLDWPFRAIDAAASGARDRFAAIDGLRGLLAFGVFGHHAVVVPSYLQTGIWQAPPSSFYTLIGEMGVALFFVVTGFLFWRKLLHEHGMPDWKQLYIGRIFRIAPVYLVAVAVVLAVVWSRTRYELREPFPEVFFDTTRWLGLGLLGQPDVNQYQDTGRLLAGVTWTLRYEWLFYLCLPLLALFARRHWHLSFALGGALACCALHVVYQTPPALYAGLFFFGMIPASLDQLGLRICVGRKLAPVITLACLWLLFTQYSTVMGAAQLLLMGIFFSVLSVGDASLEVLKARPVRRLGEISYSVYLLHGLVLMGVFSIGAVRDYALASNGGCWLVIAVCGVLVIAISTMSHLLIERPGIGLGRKLARRFAEPRAEEGGKSAAA